MLVVVLRTLRPNLWGFFGIALALGAAMLGLGLVGLTFDSQADWATTAFGLGLFGAVPFATGLVFAGLVAGRQAPRAWLFAVAFVVSLATTLLGAVLFLATEPFLDALLIVVLFFGPALLLSGAPALGYSIGGIAELREAIDAWRREEVLVAAREAGRARLPEVAEEVGLTEEEVAETLADAIESGTMRGRLEPEHGWWWSPDALKRGLESLANRVTQDGQVELGDLAKGLEVPEDVARRWIYEAGHRGQLTGYVNWKTGTIFSTDADALRAGRECPVCGGQLELRGSGSARCRHCGTDLLLGAA